jgi:hypothetical protein
MEISDRNSSLFWLLFSLCIFIESVRLGVGTFRNPSTGFMTFWASGLLGGLSLILFFKSTFGRRGEETPPLFYGKLWGRILAVLVALLCYALLMKSAGYLIDTFLLMMFLFWIVRGQKLRWVFLFSLLTTLITYYVFSVWLKGQFPEGLFGF